MRLLCGPLSILRVIEEGAQHTLSRCGWVASEGKSPSGDGHWPSAGKLVAGLGDRLLDAYVLPPLQGQEGGWLGEHAVDHLRNALHATRHPDQVDA